VLHGKKRPLFIQEPLQRRLLLSVGKALFEL
jgi:hypothetical protein